jgi:hypothetical protein
MSHPCDSDDGRQNMAPRWLGTLTHGVIIVQGIKNNGDGVVKATGTAA